LIDDLRQGNERLRAAQEQIERRIWDPRLSKIARHPFSERSCVMSKIPEHQGEHQDRLRTAGRLTLVGAELVTDARANGVLLHIMFEQWSAVDV
jgi:hypothetical protein